jgi:hypothetical protein
MRISQDPRVRYGQLFPFDRQYLPVCEKHKYNVGSHISSARRAIPI